MALVTVFALLLVWNIRKVIRQDRSLRANLEFRTELIASVDEDIKSFLSNTLSQPCYGVEACYLFGSVVQEYPTHDVDIIIHYNSSNPKRIRTYRNRLRIVETKFEKFHGLKLHVQTFLSIESEAVETFLTKSGRHVRII